MHKKTITTVLDEKRQGVRICIILIMTFNTEREKRRERGVYCRSGDYSVRELLNYI